MSRVSMELTARMNQNHEEEDLESLDVNMEAADIIARHITSVLIAAFETKQGRKPTQTEVEELLSELTVDRITTMINEKEGVVDDDKNENQCNEENRSQHSIDDDSEEENDDEDNQDQEDMNKKLENNVITGTKPSSYLSSCSNDPIVSNANHILTVDTESIENDSKSILKRNSDENDCLNVDQNKKIKVE